MRIIRIDDAFAGVVDQPKQVVLRSSEILVQVVRLPLRLRLSIVQ